MSSFWKRPDPLPPGAPPPPLAPGLVRCRYCRHGIRQEGGGGAWTTPTGEPPATGATLPLECPGRPVEGWPGTFGRHEPAT
ncbi:hypothetical protein ITP53_39305 [Nonomuraea sp. K274]|uniref:Uncharacterized protein n=1 Tax=Nonomuraea cypriaca TaxID=1187855 RepID=A0A931AMH6_9ACTN|nr:hypothetical protein [Nonomuraea cypriaca]MBF8191642.1 hypothetical protein [Nonomuraea cypriaca]